MKLRRLIFLSSLVLAVAALSPAAAQGATRHHIEIKGTSTSTSTINLATGKGTTDGTSHVSRPCGTATFHNDFTYTQTGPDTFRLVGTDTFVCAKRNQLFSTLTITGTVSTGAGTGVLTTTGGTGRFVHASGTATIPDAKSTIVSTVGPIVMTRDTNTFKGRISY
jgi:hypothetical protein